MIMIELLILLQIKHWFIDFYNQTNNEVKAKGEYGNLLGIWHSGKHAILTGIIFILVDLELAIVVCTMDFLLHYHIDWIKMNYGNRDINDKRFWMHLGLDQFAHQICYIFYVYLGGIL